MFQSPVVPPVAYRVCRDSARDPEGGFCDATALWGIAHTIPTNRQGAVTIADFDNDGFFELLLTVDNDVPPVLLTPRLGYWADVTEAWGLLRFSAVFVASAADLDGDGDQDLLIQPSAGPARLLRNTGSTFEEAGTLGGGSDKSAGWLIWDFDRDGLLDLVQGVVRRGGDCASAFGILGCPGTVVAWRQRAPWTFSPVRVSPLSRRVQGLRVHDWDHDGRDELLVVSDLGLVDGGNVLLRIDQTVDGFALTDITRGSGFDHQLFGMGMGLLDVDGDNLDDVFISNFGHNVLLTSARMPRRDCARWLAPDAYGISIPGERPRFRYFDRENLRERGMHAFQEAYLDPDSSRFPTTKWAPVVFDYDGDGLDDVYLPAGSVSLDSLFPEPAAQAGTLLRNSGGGLSDVTDALALRERANSYGAAAGDLDSDGDVDLAVVHRGEGGRLGGVRVLRNDVQGVRMLTVIARGRGTARQGLGAWVDVRVGARTVRRRVDGNLSLCGTAPHQVSVGLRGAAMADEVRVHFPSGRTARRTDVPAGRVIIDE